MLVSSSQVLLPSCVGDEGLKIYAVHLNCVAFGQGGLQTGLIHVNEVCMYIHVQQ